MSKARALLRRVAAVEASNVNPLLAKIGGSLEGFERRVSKLEGGEPHMREFLVHCMRDWINGTRHTYGDEIPTRYREECRAQAEQPAPATNAPTQCAAPAVCPRAPGVTR